MAGGTEIDLRRDDPVTFQEQSERKAEFKVLRHEGYVLEMEHLHFGHDSIFMFPDYNIDGNDDLYVTSIAVVAQTLIHARDNTDQKLLIVGHADSSGPSVYNFELSLKRANVVKSLVEGDGDGWVGLIEEKHKVRDRQHALKWAARTRAWNCDPGACDNIDGPMTRNATKWLKQNYNFDVTQSANEEVEVNETFDNDAWTIIFELIQDELGFMLEVDDAGLAEFRSNLSFVGDVGAFGGGEFFPISGSRQDNYRNPNDRRVEIMFFTAEHEPILDGGPNSGQPPDGMQVVYDPRIYSWIHVPVEALPRPVWIELHTVDVLGYFVPDTALKLVPEIGEHQTITTDNYGHYSGRLWGNGRFFVYLEDGTPVMYGASVPEEMRGGAETDPLGRGPTAIIHPRLTRRAITEIVVPGENDAIIEEQREAMAIYSRPPRTGRQSVRAVPHEMGRGEPTFQEISSRGPEHTHTMVILEFHQYCKKQLLV
ncbi:MAG: hypothetical protein AAGF15_09490 [Pseudomonadota bacterium]